MVKITLDEGPWMKPTEPLKLGYTDWIAKYNDKNKVVAGLPDYFALARFGDDKTLQSVQNDMMDWIIAGPVIEYNTESYKKESKIIHYFGSNVVKPKERKIVIPYYDEIRLEFILNSDEGLDFFQKLLETRAGKKTIIKAMERLNDKNVHDMYVWTPNLNGRKNNPRRAVSLNCNDVGFHINCYINMNYDGRSRAVKGAKRPLSSGAA